MIAPRLCNRGRRCVTSGPVATRARNKSFKHLTLELRGTVTLVEITQLPAYHKPLAQFLGLKIRALASLSVQASKESKPFKT